MFKLLVGILMAGIVGVGMIVNEPSKTQVIKKLPKLTQHHKAGQAHSYKVVTYGETQYILHKDGEFVAYTHAVPLIAQDDDGRHGSPHVKDPAECRKFCYPPGGNSDRPGGVNESAEGYECKGDYCAKAGSHDHGGGGPPPGEEGPGDDEKDCKPHFSCNVHCSEVCCKCLRECI